MLDNFRIHGNRLNKCNAKTETIIIPDGVVIISSSAFRDNYCVKRIILPDSVTIIETAAFQDCRNLEYVKLSKSLRQIGKRAFAYCTNLVTIDYDESILNNILDEESSFLSCPVQLQTLRLKKKLEAEERRKQMELERLREENRINTMPLSELRKESYDKYLDRIKKMDSIHPVYEIVDGELLSAHQYETVIRCTIPVGVKSIAPNAFEGAYIQELFLPDSLEEIHSDAFVDCSISKIHFPASLKIIEDAFNEVEELEHVEFPINCTIEIDSDGYLFSGCPDLKTITLPRTLEYVDFYIADECEALETIYITNPEMAISNDYLPEEVEIKLSNPSNNTFNSNPTTVSFDNLKDLANSFIPEKDFYGILCPDDISFSVQEKIDDIMVRYLSSRQIYPQKYVVGNIRLIASKTQLWIIRSFCCNMLTLEVILKADMETKSLSFSPTYPPVDCYYPSVPEIWLAISSYFGIPLNTTQIMNINQFLKKQLTNTVCFSTQFNTFINSNNSTLVLPNNVIRHFIK